MSRRDQTEGGRGGFARVEGLGRCKLESWPGRKRENSVFRLLNHRNKPDYQTNADLYRLYPMIANRLEMRSPLKGSFDSVPGMQ